MKHITLFAIGFCVITNISCAVQSTTDSQGRPLATISCKSPRSRSGYGPPPYQYWRVVGGIVPKEGFALEPTTDSVGPMFWTFMGPKPITNEYWSGNENAGGRVPAIACHPTNAAIAYIGSASGGVWKTDNSGVNWTPLTDAMPNMNHGAITIDRTFPNTVYAGTGEYTSGSQGDGLYRTLDSGQTWSSLATSTTLGNQCSGLEVISGSTAATPSAIHWTGSGGYRRSTNGGATWTNGGVTASCSSLAVNRSDPQQLYIAQSGIGIQKSTNGGTSFTLLTGGLPTADLVRIVLAISSSAPSTLYAAFVNSSACLEGLYKTVDGGTNWTKLTATPNFPSPQGYWDLTIGVDPTNPNHVYCGGVSPIYAIAGVIETTNGGTSWTEISASGGNIHPDQQYIAFDANNIPWFGCDGGVWRRVNNSWVNCNSTLAANQNYSIAQHPLDPNRMMVGTQDNGSAATTSASLAWPQIMGGDGGYGAYDSSNFSTLYTTYVYLTIWRYVNTTQTCISDAAWENDPRELISPLVIDVNAPNTLYCGTNRIWRNVAASTSSSWTNISDTTIANGGTISAIATVKNLPNVVWVGNSLGGVWRTLNSGKTWQQMRSSDGVCITTIAAKPSNHNSAFISRNTASGSRVLQTHNGTTWINVTETLPENINAKTIAVDWGRSVPTIYLGSGAGIYATFTLGALWIKNGTDLPNVNIGQLEINPTERTIIVGTYGRGAWRSPMPLPPDINADGRVDGADLTFLLAAWGTCPSSSLCPEDITMNGVVDGADLALLLSAFDH